MPSPVTPRRASGRTVKNSPVKKPVDIGKPLGPYDNNSVRDRVRHWQASGGGVVTTSDPLADVADEEVVEKPLTPSVKEQERQKIDSPVDVLSVQAQAYAAREKAQEDTPTVNNNKSISTPKKRIVSDGHWRRKRSPPKNADKTTAKGKTTTKPLADDGIRVTPILGKALEDKGKVKDLRSTQSTPRKKKPGQNDGIRVYATPPLSRRASAHTDRLSDNGSENNKELHENEKIDKNSKSFTASPSTAEPSRDPVGTSAEEALTPTDRKLTSSDRTNAKSDLSRDPSKSPSSPLKDEQQPPISKKTSKRTSKGIFAQVFDESRKMFGRSETIYVQPSDNPRIDAWLGGVPDVSEDPFVADDIPPELPPVEIPAPLNIKPRRKRRSRESDAPLEDANKIWDSISQRDAPLEVSSAERRRRRMERRSSKRHESSIQSSEPHDAVDKDVEEMIHETTIETQSPTAPALTSPSSPSSLRRRNARRKSTHSPRGSPARETRASSPLKDAFIASNEERHSHISSADSVSSVEPIDPSNPLKPPPLTSRRPFPSVGQHRLSTILSVDTLGSKAKDQASQSVSGGSDTTVQPRPNIHADMSSKARDHLDPNALGRSSSKSRLTRHTDLISILSAPRGEEKSIKSARSIRTNRSRLETATVDDVLRELADDEVKYMRELRTLVDGVIPVLLSCVLSKTESAIAAGLFSPSGNAAKDPAITKPIIDMGICLERLKAWHKRIEPRNGRPPSATSFLNWASGIHKTYSDYLKSWRMGFQDVVVNLAPASAEETKDPTLEAGLPRNEQGDVTDSNGERVDVAFLLKRPLVRLKYLAKTLRGINHLLPSALAEKLSRDFQELVEEARHRANEERARLEDEAAANIDPTRARDVRTLGPLPEVYITRTRRVRARDSFDLTLSHSSGQQIDCRIELLLRDDPPGEGTDADLLICEVDGTGRWLLFPPITADRVSARNGDQEREIIVMLRGVQSNGQEWQELLALKGDEEQTGFEWVQMLGLTPVPPAIGISVSKSQKLGKASASNTLQTGFKVPAATSPDFPTTPTKSRTPSPHEVAVPFGEHSAAGLRRWKSPSNSPSTLSSQISEPLKSRTRLQKRPTSQTADSIPWDYSKHSGDDSVPTETHSRSDMSKKPANSPTGVQSSEQVTASSPSPGLQRYKRYRDSKASTLSAGRSASPSASGEEGLPAQAKKVAQETVFDRTKSDPTSPRLPSSPEASLSTRPRYRQRIASAPLVDAPLVNRLRKSGQQPQPLESDDQVDEISAVSKPTTPKKLTKAPPPQTSQDSPPPPPPHRSPPSSRLGSVNTPEFSPGLRRTNRRPSSPLKHEYEPSTATESSSDSDGSTIGQEEPSSMSDTSSEDEDEDSENDDVAMPLLPVGALQRPRPPPASMPSLPSKTLGPSSSASQAPYKTVPSQPQKASRTVASIFYWDNKGTWEALHPDECSIAITPGLIEAYEMSAAHSFAEEQGLASSKSGISGSSSASSGPRPLIALELTPLVPIRRGTALDISIRSPPTAGSKITSITNNNVMFRSRSPEECEALYALINYSRINNPTYIALQNARATSFAPQLVNAGINRGKTTRAPASSWFNLGRRRSYRASSAPTPSISRQSDSSINSASSAFSALKLFKGSSRFSIHKSTVLSRSTSRTGSIYTSSDNSSGSGTSTPIPPGSAGGVSLSPIPGLDGGSGAAATSGASAPIGLSNAKIRLYIRESASKWRDLGSARLTIMRPTNSSHPLAPAPAATDMPASSSSGSSSTEGRDTEECTGTAFGIGAGGAASPGRRQTADDKRILVVGKSKGESLLDVTLGESCFERVARTGIAVSVWENFEGGMVAKDGGVGGGRLKVFMIQVSLILICFVGGLAMLICV